MAMLTVRLLGLDCSRRRTPQAVVAVRYRFKVMRVHTSTVPTEMVNL